MFKYTVLTFLLFNLLPAQPTYGHTPDFSDSIAESKKEHLFRSTVRVCPESFEWQGHRIEIAECWLEGTWLRFKFSFDGNMTNQNRIQHREHKYLKFDQEIPEPDYSTSSYTTKLGRNYIFGGADGEVVYHMRLKQPEPSQIKLKVFTTEINRARRPMVKTIPSDTILTFFLSETNRP